MKRIIALILAVSSLVILLSACGEKDKSEKKPSKEANINIDINMPEKDKGEKETTAPDFDYDGGMMVETDIAETRAPESGEVKPFFMNAYYSYLSDNQENMGHAYYYEKGNGRFALLDLTADDTPELLIIAEDGATMILTYKDGEVVNLGFIAGGTDIIRYGYITIRYYTDVNRIVIEKADGSGFIFYRPASDFGYETNSYIMTHELYVSDGDYYFNTYDVHKLYEDGFDYIINEFEQTKVSKKEYEEAVENFGIREGELCSISEKSFYPLTPEYIEKICG